MLQNTQGTIRSLKIDLHHVCKCFCQITSEQESGKDVTAPKHGKMDSKNAPHVGGNTWAGGTGGRDTAGLGGKGGPYRLDAGHDVTQVRCDVIIDFHFVSNVCLSILHFFSYRTGRKTPSLNMSRKRLVRWQRKRFNRGWLLNFLSFIIFCESSSQTDIFN